MNREQLLTLLKKLNLPKDEYYVLSGASLVIRGIRDQAGDLDLCISKKLYEQIKEKYSLTEDKKNECGFYHVNDSLEIVVNEKQNFNMEICEPCNLEDLNTILEFKRKRNQPKDQVDIERIQKYQKEKNNYNL